MNLQQLLSLTRRAVDDYTMINENDVIAVGVSGGKDSLTLLSVLCGLRRFYPNKFTLKAISVDLGFNNQDFTKIEDFCKHLDVPFHIVHSEISEIVFNQRKELNPCSLCAKMRKGALNEEMKKLGCNKVAYGHHKDDIIETMLLSLLYEGRFHSFSPVTYLDRMNITVIRPLMYVNEMDILGFVKKTNLPIAKSQCPVDGYTKRQYVKELLVTLNRENPGAKERMFTAILRGDIKGWPMKNPIHRVRKDTNGE